MSLQVFDFNRQVDKVGQNARDQLGCDCSASAKFILQRRYEMSLWERGSSL